MSTTAEERRERVAQELFEITNGAFTGWPPPNDLLRDIYRDRADRVLALLEGERGEPVAWRIDQRPSWKHGLAWGKLRYFESEKEANEEVRQRVKLALGPEYRVVPLYAEPPARVPSESEGGRSTSESECRELAAELRAEGREGSADCILDVLDALARSRLCSVTEGSVEGKEGSAEPNPHGGEQAPTSAGPEVLPHVPDTAGEVDVMPGRVRT